MSKKIYIAKTIITMNPSMPEATHIAIDGDKIVAVGNQQAISHLKDFQLDEQFKDKVLLPGFVEGHAHAINGTIWNYVYLGRFARKNLNGEVTEDFDSLEKIKNRLLEADKLLPSCEPLICWGFDPIYFSTEKIDKKFLDTISTERPIIVMHANMHLCNINSKLIEKIGLNKDNLTECVLVDENGEITGDLKELDGLGLAFSALGVDLFNCVSKSAYMDYAKTAQQVGITTITDLYSPLNTEAIQAMAAATEQDDFSIRLVPVFGILGLEPEYAIKQIKQLKDAGNDKLYYGSVKLMTDGSIQGYTGRLKSPYHDGSTENGMWNAPPETLKQLVHMYHQAEIQLHIHTNGDEASEIMIEAINEALTMWPNLDHRHTLQHCQLPDQSQLRRMARLGICANFFANHIYYWGDVHRDKTLGYERSQRLDPLASALRNNVIACIHSDAPVTPLGPLFSVQCAVTRRTSSGDVLGKYERVTVQQALEMVTINAAYTLHLDDKVGSLEIGKFADIAVLDDNPLFVDVEKIAEIKVHRTITGGDIYGG